MAKLLEFSVLTASGGMHAIGLPPQFYSIRSMVQRPKGIWIRKEPEDSPPNAPRVSDYITYVK